MPTSAHRGRRLSTMLWLAGGLAGTPLPPLGLSSRPRNPSEKL